MNRTWKTFDLTVNSKILRTPELKQFENTPGMRVNSNAKFTLDFTVSRKVKFLAGKFDCRLSRKRNWGTKRGISYLRQQLELVSRISFSKPGCYTVSLKNFDLVPCDIGNNNELYNAGLKSVLDFGIESVIFTRSG